MNLTISQIQTNYQKPSQNLKFNGDMTRFYLDRLDSEDVYTPTKNLVKMRNHRVERDIRMDDEGKSGYIYHNCTSKVRYENEHQAQRAIKSMFRKKPWLFLHAYPCSKCNGWHIGRDRILDKGRK